MKKSMLFAAALVAASTVGAEAQSLFTPQSSTPGVYIGGEGGLNWLLNTGNHQFHTRYPAGGQNGYDFVGPRLRPVRIYHNKQGPAHTSFGPPHGPIQHPSSPVH